jgi:hypothetical protein
MSRLLRRGLRTPHSRRRASAFLFLAITGWWTASVSAQLDPLLFAKRVPPTVVIIVDTSLRMLEDGSGNLYDPLEYTSSTDPTVATALGVAAAPRYRRIYKNLQYTSLVDASTKFEADDITAIGSTSASYSAFYNDTRLEIATTGIRQAVGENAGSTYRWGLIKLRQTSPAWRASPNCDKPVRVTGNATLASLSDANPCNAGSTGKFGIYVPSVASANYTNETLYGGTARLVTPAGNTATSMMAITSQAIGIAADSSPRVPARRHSTIAPFPMRSTMRARPG